MTRALPLLALLLLTAAPAPAQSVTLYPTPSGTPCLRWGGAHRYQHDAWNRTHCDEGGRRWAMGKAKP